MGYVYPAYACFKALERRKPDGVRAWCEYWCVRAAASARRNRPPSCCAPRTSRSVLTRDRRRRLVLAVFTVLESVGDQTVFWRAPRCSAGGGRSLCAAHALLTAPARHRLPLYNETKVVFVTWLWHPRTQARPARNKRRTSTSPAFSALPPPNLTPNA